MEPCFLLAEALDNLCCWGRRPTLPLSLQSFCVNHSHKFIEHVLQAYYTHFVKIALFVSTVDTFYVIFHKGQFLYQVFAWRVKDLVPVDGLQPLHFKKTVSGTLEYSSVVNLLDELPCFQMYALLVTPLTTTTVIPNIHVSLHALQVKSLTFDAVYPAFMVPVGSFIPVHVLRAPFVMLLQGSTTPDPRLYNSGTSSLWDTITSTKFPVQNVRYGLFLQSIKTVFGVSKTVLFHGDSTKPDHPDTDRANEGKSEHQQFFCDL